MCCLKQEVDRKTGEYQTALERLQSLQVSIERKDRFRQEHNLGRMGLIYESIGEYTIAIEHYKEALKIFDRCRGKRNQSIHLANLGLIHEHLGDYDRATLHYQKVGDSRRTWEQRSVGTYLGNLGNALQRRGLIAESIKYMRHKRYKFQNMRLETIKVKGCIFPILKSYNGSGRYPGDRFLYKSKTDLKIVMTNEVKPQWVI